MSASFPPGAVAIIGMACRFPGAPDLDSFWRVIRDNRDVISRFPASEAEDAFDAATRADNAYVGARGIIDEVDCFDAAFFKTPPRDAALTDPQHRVLLELAQHTFDHAGYDPLVVKEPIGVFAGGALNTYLLGHVLADPAEAEAFRSNYGVGMYSHLVGALADTLATRIAFKLNLRGPAVNVQGACATGLLAVAQACQSLQLYQCDMALAGAVSLTFPQKRGYLHQAGGMVSADGFCRPFDAQASGTVFGGGAGLVLLKRLDDALADGDVIHAVIRGVGLSNDGADKAAFTAPSPQGQAEAIRMALAAAEAEPETIGFVECHGTATPIGDPIEIEGLRRAFGRPLAQQSCALGSVKANIGHLDAAAGISGLIKAALCVREGLLPAQLHFENANPALQLDRSPFYVPAQHGAWPERATPRRAGVSAFGVGGVNAHLVLEQAPPRMEQTVAPGPLVLTVSTHDASLWSAEQQRIRDAINALDDEQLKAFAATLQSGRRHGALRGGWSADDAEGLRTAVAVDGQPTQCRPKPDWIFLCPGQGAQTPGAGRSDNPVFQTALRQALAALPRDLRDELTQLLCEAGAEDPQAMQALRQTALAQPALVAIGWALSQVWANLGVQPRAIIGHSVGEITAAAVAGVWPIAQAMRFAAARGAAMQAAPAGAMLAIRAAAADVVTCLPAGIEIAAINAPLACVVSGPIAAIAAFEPVCSERGWPARRLETSHAFHNALMEGAQEQIAVAAGHLASQPTGMEIFSTSTGENISADALSAPDYWREQCRAPVQFAKALAAAFAAGPAIALELGPGRASLGFAAQTLNPDVRIDLIEGITAARGDAGLAAAALHAWRSGADINWSYLTGLQRPMRWPLPPRVFARARHWIDPANPNALSAPPPPPFSTPEPVMTQPLPPAPSTTDRLADVLALLETVSGAALGADQTQASFLELGFDSLLLGQVATKLEKQFKIRIGFRQLLADIPTPAALAALVSAQSPSPQPASSPQISAPAAPNPIAAIPPQNGELSALFKSQLDALSNLIAQQNMMLAGQGAPAAAPVAPAMAPPPKPAAIVPRFKMFDPKAQTPAAPFTDAQRRYIGELSRRAESRAGKSKAYAQSHRDVLADPRTAAGFRPEWKEIAFPVVAARAKGARIWGLDGESYIDLVNGYGQTAFGHAPDFVTEAVRHQLDAGFAIGPQSDLAGPLARELAEVLGLDRVTFCNTGSEAVMAAMRVARAVTGRDKVVVFANDYHGQFDEVLVKPGPRGAAAIAAGIPPEAIANMVVLAYGEGESLDWIAANTDDIAAVIVEPVQSRHPELAPREFLARLREITSAAGAALVFDEVVTGFRVSIGGMQAEFGIRADMATYGKVLGGGLPIGVLAGAARFMDALDGGPWRFGDTSQPEVAPTFFAGTFVRHPLALAACAATLRHMRTAGPALQNELTAATGQLVQQLRDVVQRRGASVRIETFASWFMLNPSGQERAMPLLAAEMRAQGIHVQDGYPCFLTTAHGATERAEIVTAFDAALENLQRAGFFCGDGSARTAVPAAINPTRIPLTEGQLEILLAANFEGAAPEAFHESVSVTVNAALEGEALRRAFNKLGERFPILRARVEMEGPALVLDGAPLDLSELASAQDLASAIARDSRAHFALETGPLMRGFWRSENDRTHIVLCAHHLVCDGWSMNKVVTDLAALYDAEVGRSAALTPVTSNFADMARAQPVAPNALSFWKDLHQQAASPITLPYARTDAQPFAGATATALLDAALITQVRKVGARHGCTLFVTMLAAVQTLIAQLSGEKDFAIGCPLAGQAESGFEDVVGHGVRFLPLRAPIGADDDLAARLNKLRAHVNQALDNAACTYGALVRALAPTRAPDQPPLVQVLFNLERLGDNLSFSDHPASLIPNPKTGAVFDLFFNMVDGKDGVRLDIDYRADRYSPEIVSRWIANLRNLLEQIARDAPGPILGFDILGKTERDWLLARNPKVAPIESTRTVLAVFAEMVRRHPHATAVRTLTETISYQELNQRADDLAHALAAQGVAAGARVAMILDRGVNAITTMLAVLKCSAAYAPLDAKMGASQLASALKDLAPALILSDAPRPGAITLATLSAQKHEPKHPLSAARDSKAAAYVMFTSGTTGKPKGVEINHLGIVRLACQDALMPFGPGAVMLHAAPLAFDASTLEIWGPLLNGGCVAIHEPAEIDAVSLKHLISTTRATGAWLTAGLFHAIASEAPRALEGLSTLITGGDVVNPQAVAAVQKALPQLRIVNGYGPTENTTFTATYAFPNPPEPGPAPIGAPLAYGRVFVVNERLELAPRGAIGELVVAGAGLANGYLGDDLDQRFVTGACLGEQRVYRTGDFARWREDGALEFHGRRDGLVKLHGHRVELAGVRATLCGHPDIADAFVFLRRGQDGDKLCAAIARHAHAAHLDADALRPWLSAHLAVSQTPRQLVFLPTLPRTANGKVDRAAIEAAFVSPATMPTAAPVAEVPQHQRAIQKIWQDVLHRGDLATDQGIFDLGADSLHIFRIAARMNDAGLAISSRRLLANPSIADLAAELAHAATTPPQPSAATVLPLASFRRDRRSTP